MRRARIVSKLFAHKSAAAGPARAACGPPRFGRIYRQEADRQKDTVRKARLTENRLLFIVTALKQLFRDENFVTLMRAEQMEMLPAYLAERIQAAEKG